MWSHCSGPKENGTENKRLGPTWALAVGEEFVGISLCCHHC